MTQKWLPGSHPRVTPSDPKAAQKWLENKVRSRFWVTFGSMWVGPQESLLSHFSKHIWITLKFFLCFCRVRRTPTSRLLCSFDIDQRSPPHSLGRASGYADRKERQQLWYIMAFLSEPIFGKGMRRSNFQWKKRVFQWKGGRHFSESAVW